MVKIEDESVQCDLYDKWNHAFCVDISSAKYEKLKLSTLPWYSPICAKETPFSSLSHKKFYISLIDKRTKDLLKNLKDFNQSYP